MFFVTMVMELCNGKVLTTYWRSVYLSRQALSEIKMAELNSSRTVVVKGYNGCLPWSMVYKTEQPVRVRSPLLYLFYLFQL